MTDFAVDRLRRLTATGARAPALRTIVLRCRDQLIVLGLLVVVAVTHGVNMYNAPSTVMSDDEGTYVAQAWAILHLGEWAHYTYTWDHPPLGWLQIAGWAWLTDAFDRTPSGVAVGREVALIAVLASTALLYVLARRIGLDRPFAVAAVLLFALNPLSLVLQRMAFLDNLAVAWLLAAFVLATSPRRRLEAQTASALCFTTAVLTKETVFILLPAYVYQLWQSTDRRRGRYSFALPLAMLLLILSYPLYAALKSELLPGEGHVSLWDAAHWQLFGRVSSGSVFDPSSTAREVISGWLGFDAILLMISALLVLPALVVRALRPVAVAFLIQLAMTLRGGYLPRPYVLAVLPFASLVIAGVIAAAWRTDIIPTLHRLLGYRLPTSLRLAIRVPVLVAVTVVSILLIVPTWSPRIAAMMSADQDASVRQSVDWIRNNVRPDDKVIVSDAMWVDLVQSGFPRENVIWYYKADLDPEVRGRLPNGWRDVSYVAFMHEMDDMARSAGSDVATTIAARENAAAVASFGATDLDRIVIYRVNR